MASAKKSESEKTGGGGGAGGGAKATTSKQPPPQVNEEEQITMAVFTSLMDKYTEDQDKKAVARESSIMEKLNEIKGRVDSISSDINSQGKVLNWLQSKVDQLDKQQGNQLNQLNQLDGHLTNKLAQLDTKLDSLLNHLGNQQAQIIQKLDDQKSNLNQDHQASSSLLQRLDSSISKLDGRVSSHLEQEQKKDREIIEIMGGKRLKDPLGLASSSGGGLSPQQCADFQKILQLVRAETDEVRRRHELFLSMIDAQQGNILQVMSSSASASSVISHVPSFLKPSKSISVGFYHEDALSGVVNSVVDDLQGYLMDYELKKDIRPLHQGSSNFSPRVIFLLIRVSERIDDGDVVRKIGLFPEHIPKCILMLRPRANPNFQEEHFVRFSCPFYLLGYQQGGSSLFSCPQNEKALSESASLIRNYE